MAFNWSTETASPESCGSRWSPGLSSLRFGENGQRVHAEAGQA
jgi:hypothetical protein